MHCHLQYIFSNLNRKKMSNIIKQINSKLNKPKVQIGLGLAVSALSLIAPKESKSYNYCKYGSSGDCDLDTNGDERCIATTWLADCT